MQPVLFSVIVPTYNYANQLPFLIDSILNQDQGDVEIIVVDDCSTDQTVALFEQRVSFPTVQLIQQAYNQGPAAARNRGVAVARGEYLLFIDADDTLAADAFSILRAYIAQYPQTELIVGDHLTLTEDQQTKRSPFKKIDPHIAKRLRDFLIDKQLLLCNGAMVFKRHVLERLKFPASVRQYEDLSFHALCLVLCVVDYIPEPLVIVHTHAASLRHIPSTVENALAAVDALFESPFLPKALYPLKRVSLAQCYLSLFRSYYHVKQYKTARQYYHQAVKHTVWVLFKMAYLRKYVRSFVF
jgi:glycosyltransferase involved in cell wall biosynthesis